MSSPSEPPRVVARGADFLVADKPAGLATTGRDLDDPDCLQSQLMTHLARRKVWAVHQLDKPTSGLCLFALRKPSVAVWAERLRDGKKVYLGLVDGALTGIHEVRAPLGRVVMPDGRTQPGLVANGKSAHSTVRALATSQGQTLVTVQIHTGRTHQVRLHLAHLGYPLVGEQMHRHPPCTVLPRPALHSWLLELEGPSGEPLRLEAAVPPRITEAARRAGLALPSSVGFWSPDA
jgi:23S rRNA-/tRNA-specific pseudouridylate synthase